MEDDHCESLFIEINNYDKTFIVCVIYLPPDSVLDTLYCKLEDLLHKLNNQNNQFLPTFSKVMEKVAYNRLSGYPDKLDILVPSQYGFRKKEHNLYGNTRPN